MELFGFKIERTKKVPEPQQSFTPPVTDDGTSVVSAGGYFGQYLDMEGTAKSEADLIQRYREVELHPECDMAVEDIVNEAVVADESVKSVKINVDNIDFSDDNLGCGEGQEQNGFIDQCGVCSGGETGITPNASQDCSGT